MCSRVVLDDSDDSDDTPTPRKGSKGPPGNDKESLSDSDVFPDTGGSMKDFQVASKQVAQALKHT